MRNIAIYRCPKERECVFVMSEGATDILDDYTSIDSRHGFVVSPFEIRPGMPLVCISPQTFVRFDDADSIDKHTIDAINSCCTENATFSAGRSTTRKEYADAFNTAQCHLGKHDVEKIVLARCETVGHDASRKAMDMFASACAMYPRAFVALFSTPDTGTWLVATPEILIERTDGRYHTMALAGTMSLRGDAANFDTPIGAGSSSVQQMPAWSDKNRQEQAYVADYISDVLKRHANKVERSTAKTIRAANVVHLCTDFMFELECKSSLGALIADLHPTSAVCGMPKNKAKELIGEIETTPRLYYSGFCGPVGLSGHTALYVSLRCMRISETCCELYAGGGLLSESSEQDEWDETISKMDTMKSCIAIKKT